MNVDFHHLITEDNYMTESIDFRFKALEFLAHIIIVFLYAEYFVSRTYLPASSEDLTYSLK